MKLDDKNKEAFYKYISNSFFQDSNLIEKQIQNIQNKIDNLIDNLNLQNFDLKELMSAYQLIKNLEFQYGNFKNFELDHFLNGVQYQVSYINNGKI